MKGRCYLRKGGGGRDLSIERCLSKGLSRHKEDPESPGKDSSGQRGKLVQSPQDGHALNDTPSSCSPQSHTHKTQLPILSCQPQKSLSNVLDKQEKVGGGEGWG